MNEDQSSSLPVIAVLGGTGKEGPGLALRWVCAGYRIIIGSRQKEKAEAAAAALLAELEQKGIGDFSFYQGRISGKENMAAAQEADICVLTVVQSAHQAALESLKTSLQGKILVDATARVDFRDPKPPAPPSAARIAQEILGPGVRVAAAFQNVPSHALKKNLGGRLDAEVLICADDLPTAEAIMRLAEAGGMRAYYAGDLDNALIVEGLTSLLISLNKYYGTKTASIKVAGIERSN